MDITSSLDRLTRLMRRADTAVMTVYRSDFSVEAKADNTPLTQADKAAHLIITDGLHDLFPDIPVISEEGDSEKNERTLRERTFWLVDPLDGTKQFVAKNGEFCICAGLIVDGRPYFGIVSAPVTGLLYYGGQAFGSFKRTADGPVEPITTANNATGVVMASSTGGSGPTSQYIAQHHPTSRVEQLGSMLKFVRVAEGRADAYPSISRTLHAWDIAAGHAILEGSGGSVVRPDGSLVAYDESLMAGDFIARSHR